MIWWKYKLLAAHLRDNAVTQNQYRMYLVFFWLQVLFSVPSAYLDPVMFVVTTLMWLGTAYLVNKKGDNKDYFRRIVCLDLPISLKAFVLTLPLVSLGFVLLVAAHVEPEDGKVYLEWFAELVSLCLYMMFTIKGVRIASTPAASAA